MYDNNILIETLRLEFCAGRGCGVSKVRGVHPGGRAGDPWQRDGGHGQPVRFLFRVARPLAVQQVAADTVQSGRAGRGAGRRRGRRAGRQRREPVSRHAQLPGPVGHWRGRLQRPPVRRPQWKRSVTTYHNSYL